MKTFARKPKKHPVQNRGFANYLGENKEQHSPILIHPPAQAKWQQIADNSPRVAQMKAYQEMSNRYQPIQRYSIDPDTNYLVSKKERAVLKEDGSKELYLADGMLDKAKQELANQEIQSFTLEAAGEMEYHNRSYNKVTSKFVLGNSDDKKMESQTVREQRITNNTEPDATPMYEKRFTELREQQEKITGTLPALNEIATKIDENVSKQAILSQLKTRIMNEVLGRDLWQRLILYCHNDNTMNITKESVLKDLRNRITSLITEAEAYYTNDPYLTSSCIDLKSYLIRNSKGGKVGERDNKPTPGNYHSMSFSDKKDKHGPWNNHFATIIFKDGPDTVSLEDAAGQSMQTEKTHWYYKMYGPVDLDQSFEQKTEREYERRKKQQSTLKDLGYKYDQRMSGIF